MHEMHKTRRVRILVKAFPQPSTKHEETVCCAGITEDTNEFLRLFPIRYRRLSKENQFDRYDLVEMRTTKASDHRPESYQVDETSIRLIEKGSRLSDESKVRLWKPFIASSIKALIEENKSTHRSLGIIKPDVGSLRFIIKEADKSDAADRDVAELLYQQESFLEEPLKPLKKPEYSFYYQFTCVGYNHTHQIHDWEVQAAYLHYKKRYSKNALKMMEKEYQENIPNRNLHFIMGTMKAHPQTFIVIGLLRSGISPDELERLGQLF